MQETRQQLSGLNAVRFFAGIIVLLAHAHFDLNHKGIHLQNAYLPILDKGKDGVNLFFTLSGFLLTYISFTTSDTFFRFYVRRILRIWPLYYLCVFLGFFILGFVVPHLTGEHYLVFPVEQGVWCYLFFLPNYIYAMYPMQNIGSLTILWSIGVEEQFYIFFPFLIAILKKTKKPLLVIFIITCVYFIVYFSIGYRVIPVSQLSINFWETMKFHFMFSGMFFAILCVRHKDFIEKYILKKLPQAIIIVVTLLKFFTNFPLPAIFDQLVCILLYPLLIITVINTKKNIINLDNRILFSLGAITYGIYMFHPYVSYIIRFAILKMNWIEHFFLIAPFFYFIVLFLITSLVAHFSYKYYESFFLRLKRKYRR